MKKSLFYWAFLVVAGMSLTACSSGDDNIADNTTPVTPDSQNKKVILTGTIGVGGDEATRAVDDDGKTSWKADDLITINYETTSGYSRATGTITEVNSDKHFATFTATLTAPKNDGYIGFAYGTVKSASPSNAYDFEFNYDAYSSQEGTTATITSSGLDYACTESGGQVKMAVDGSTATLKSTALLKNQFSMYKFTLVQEGATSTKVPATKLKIWIGESTFTSSPAYTVTPANSNAYSVFYVALKPKEAGDKVKIVASFDGKDPAIKLDTDTKVNAITSTDYGKFLSVDANDANKQAYLCSTTNSAKYCEHTYANTTKFVKGKFYSTDLTVKVLTPTAVIAHVGAVSGYCSNFIALALEDVYSGTKTVEQARQLIGQENNWVVQHKMKIINATYDYLAGSTTTGDEGKYDVVQDNELYTDDPSASNYKQMKTNHPSQQIGLTLIKGWRIPTVTDFRYIFQDLKTGSPAAPVINQSLITATTPQGIGDQDAFYYDGQQNTETGGTGGNAKYGTGNSALYTHINHLCGNYLLQNTYYWLSSQVKDTEGNTKDNKAWRFSFSADQFEWNEADDQSLARLVFAY